MVDEVPNCRTSSLIASGSVKPIVERVYPIGEAGEALRHLIEDRPFCKVVLAGRPIRERNQ